MRTRKHIGAIGAYEGNSQLTLADIFDVAVDGSGDAAGTKIVIDGDVPRVKRIGEAMTAGEIVVKGDVDMRCGARMSGGSITAEGNADSWVGREMTGGEILVKGNARLLPGVINWSGTGTIEGDTTLPGGEMKSGTIFVNGKSARDAAVVQRRRDRRGRWGDVPEVYRRPITQWGRRAVRECVKAHSRGVLLFLRKCRRLLCARVNC